MKKSVAILLILIFSVSLISAGWFGDFWNKVTGRIVDYSCIDSDGGKDYYKKGTTVGLYWEDTINEGPLNYYDGCSFCDSNMENCKYVFEYFCREDGSVDGLEYVCPNGCENGACIEEEESCTDSDGGKNYYVKGYVTYKGYVKGGELVKEYDKCAKDVVTGEDVLQEKYCPPEGGIGTIDYKCPNGCENGVCISVPPEENKKDLTKYSEKEVFLISDKNWKDVLPIIPLTTWTGNESCQKGYGTPDNVCVYPTLIYHEENTGFDVDSIIHFIQQYDSKKITVVGETPQELDNLLITQPEFGAGLQENQIQRISIDNYLSYWEEFKDIIYVKDDYELALLASTYASLINAPLIIEGTSLDNSNIFSNRYVICVGDVNPSRNSCGEQYNLEELQQKYVNETNTDKIILVNPNDFDIKVEEEFETEKGGLINELYSKISLVSPILASAKHEVILSTIETNYEKVDGFIESKIDELYDSRYDVEYLTIIASPWAIELWKRVYFNEGTPQEWYSVDEIDNHIYGTFGDNHIYETFGDKQFQELAVGRILGYTISDASSLLNRNLFYDRLDPSKNFGFFVTPDDINLLAQVTAESIANFLESSGYVDRSPYLYRTNNPSDGIIPNFDIENDMSDLFLTSYDGHAWNNGGTNGMNLIELRNLEKWLSPTVFLFHGCGDCYLFEKYPSNQFCMELLRRGVVADILRTNNKVII